MADDYIYTVNGIFADGSTFSGKVEIDYDDATASHLEFFTGSEHYTKIYSSAVTAGFSEITSQSSDGKVSLTIDLLGDPVFKVNVNQNSGDPNVPNESGGTNNFTMAAACYCPGTLILTDYGEVAIEKLAIGDFVMIAAGRSQPVRWIGRRSYSGRQAKAQRLILPVCIKAGALGNALPHRDLWVSPGHAILIEDQLIQARLLVNGTSIVQSESVDMVTYFNFELDDHDLVIAEGVPAETFYDNGMRSVFENAAEFACLYPDHPGPGFPCLPLLEQGFVLDGIRQRIDARAGIVRSAPSAPGSLTGYVDVAGPEIVCGWAQDASHPEEPVQLDVLVDGRRVMRILANRDRADLHAAGLGSGRHSFEMRLPEGCRGTVRVCRTADYAELPLTGAAMQQAA